MSTVNINTAALVASLAVNAQQPDLSAQAAGGADAGFKALLAIGGNDSPVDDASLREESSRKDDRRRESPQDVAAPVANPALTVANPIVDLVVDTGSNKAANVPAADDAAQAASPEVPANPAQMPAKAQPQERSASAPAENTQAKDAAPAADTAQAAQPDAGEPVSDGDKAIREAIADQLGNIGKLMESLIDMLAGRGVPADVAANSAQSATDVAVDGGAVPVLSSAADVDATKQLALMKHILATVRDLKQAILNVVANGGGVVVQETTQQVSVVQSQVQVTAGAQQSQPADIAALVNKMNELLAQFMPALNANENGQPALPIAGDSQFAALRDGLKESISSIRGELRKLAADNEATYTSALERFQSQLGRQDTQSVDNQSNALLKDMLALMAKASGGVDKSEQMVPVAVAPAADKATSVNITPNPVAVAAVAAAQDGMGAGSNNSGSQQGSQNQQQVLSAGAVAGSGGLTASSSSSDATFARAMAMTTQKPVPEQVAFHIKTAANDGSSKITIQLDPEDLGKVDIKLSVKADGKTGIVITADNSNTLNLLQRDSQNLLRALSDAGLQADSGSLSFNLRGDQQQGGQQGNSQMAGNYQKAQPDEDDDVMIQAVSRQYVLNLNDGLDITI